MRQPVPTADETLRAAVELAVEAARDSGQHDYARALLALATIADNPSLCRMVAVYLQRMRDGSVIAASRLN